MKVAEFEPAGTVTVAGTLAAVLLLLDSRTVAPAVLDRVTRAVVLVSCTTVALVSVRPVGTGGAGAAMALIGTVAVACAPTLSVTVSVATQLPAA